MTELPTIPRCIHLQSKAMAIHGEDFANDPDYRDDVGKCWCVQTARALGPDNGPVSVNACSDPERDCYQEY